MLVFEDTEVGVISALAAGLRCIAVLGTMGAERLRGAERVVPELEPAIVREALGLRAVARTSGRGLSAARTRAMPDERPSASPENGDNDTRSES